MLISIKYQQIQLFSGSDKPIMLFCLLINVKMPTIIGILTFMSRKKFMLSCLEYEMYFITSGPDCCFRSSLNWICTVSSEISVPIFSFLRYLFS